VDIPDVVDLSLHTDADGTIRVGNTRVTLDVVVNEYLNGAAPDEIAENFDVLNAADVHLVIGYYLAHRAEVDAYIAEGEARSDALRQTMEADPAYQSRMDAAQSRLKQKRHQAGGA
jgi:uncharacterized protein (DUF433 family)